MLGAYTFSSAQDFLTPIQAKIDTIKQQQNAEQAAYSAQKQQLEATASSTDTRASSTKRDQEIRDMIEKKIGKPLDAPRFEVAKGFENAISSLNNLITRIGSRIAKMQAAGVDVSSSSALFETIKANLALSENGLTDLENNLALPTSTSTRTALLSRIKSQSNATKTLVETNYQSIMDLIGQLKQESETGTTSTSAIVTNDASAASADENADQSVSNSTSSQE